MRGVNLSIRTIIQYLWGRQHGGPLTVKVALALPFCNFRQGEILNQMEIAVQRVRHFIVFLYVSIKLDVVTVTSEEHVFE